MKKEEKIALVNNFIYSNFNYCPLVLHCLCKSSRKIEILHKRYRHFISNDYVNNNESLLMKNKTVNMEIKRLQVLAAEIFKTVNNMNPSYMKDVFIPKICAKLLPTVINT